MKLLVLLLSVCLLASRAQAQTGISEEKKARYEAYKQQLKLTEEQTKKFDSINAVYRDGMAGLKNSDASRMSKYKKFKALNAEKDKQMKALLNKEQFKIYKEYQEQMKQEIKDRRQG